MLYSCSISTPITSTEVNPTHTKLDITKGVITQWQVFFPPGSEGTLKIRVTKGSVPLFPLSYASYIHGEDMLMTVPEFLYLNTEPFELDILTWNDDIVNSHTLTLYVTILPLWVLYPFSPQYHNLIMEEQIRGL